VATVIESHLSKTKGPVATVIVQNGTLKIGDAVLVGGAYGRVRIMEDEAGRNQKSAGPSVPVRISGLSGQPEVGDLLKVYEDIREAQAAARITLQSRSAKRLSIKTGISADLESRQLNLIIKADTNGSLEAISQELSKLENQDVKIRIISSGIGDINESDVLSAESAKATLVGFHNSVLSAAAKLAKQKNINIDTYDIIYELTEDITRAILNMVLPEVEEVIVGRAKLLVIFAVEKDYVIAGGTVLEGKITGGKKFRIIRNEKNISEGKFVELQRNKQPATEAEAGSEFGMKITAKTKVEKGDIFAIIDERLRDKKLKLNSEA
jgi:translation initiation factor IF-2